MGKRQKKANSPEHGKCPETGKRQNSLYMENVQGICGFSCFHTLFVIKELILLFFAVSSGQCPETGKRQNSLNMESVQWILLFSDTQVYLEPTPVSWLVGWSHFRISNL